MFGSGAVFAADQWHDTTLNADYSNDGSIKRFDDNRFQVKCWEKNSGYRGGLSCLPWSEVKQR